MMMTLGAGGGGLVHLDLLIVLACAGFVTLALSRLRVAVIPAYLLAGIVIGPSGLGLISSPERIEQIGQLALIVLMFSIGMHLDAAALRKGAASIVTIGFLATIATTLLIWGALSMTELSATGALAVGMGLSMSSTAVVLRLLTQRRELQTTVGRAAIGVLLVQDLVVIGYLGVLPMLASGASGEDAVQTHSLGWQVGRGVLAVGCVAMLIVLGRLLLPRLLRDASRFAGAEVMLVLTAAAGLGAATLTAALGLSAELGAFIAGFLLASTPFKYQLAGQLAPVRDLFMAVFFTAVGLQVDLGAVAPVWWVVPVGVLALIVLKGLVIALVAWAVGAETGLAARVGLTLAQGGEFSLIVFGIAGGAGLLSPDETSVLVAVVIASLILTPAVIAAGRTIGPLVGRIGTPPWRNRHTMREEDGGASHEHAQVIVAGFGPVGRACVFQLEQAGVSCVIVEMNHRTVREQSALGRRAIFGDIANPEVIESAGGDHARAVVLTLPDFDATMRAVRTLRQMRSDLHIAVRVGMERLADTARQLGADVVIVEESISARELADQVLQFCDAEE